MACRSGLSRFEVKFLHVPGSSRATFGAQPAMQADVFVLGHDTAGLEQAGDIDVLREILRRRLQSLTQIDFLAIGREGDAIHRADVDAGVALDTELIGEDGLGIAIETALRLFEGELGIEPQLDLGADVAESQRQFLVRHLEALVVGDVVVVAPLVDAHFLADQIDQRRRALGDILTAAEFVDRNRRVMAMGYGPDDVFGPEGGITAEEHSGQGRLHRFGVDHRHAPAIEFEADIALDPRKGVLLADGDQHVIARNHDVRLAGRHQIAPALGVTLGPDLLEAHPPQTPAVVEKLLGHHIVEDRDAFMHGILLLPGRGLHLLEAAADDDRHFVTAEPARRAAAIHRRIAAAEHDDPAADLGYVAERDAGEPVDTDMDMLLGLLPAGDVEIASARCPGADEDGVPILFEHRFQAVDVLAHAPGNTETEDISDLFVDDRFRQAEFRNLAADHAAGAIVAVEDHDLVAQRRQIAGHGQRSWAGADDGNPLAVLPIGRLRQQFGDIVLVIRRHSLQPADRDRLFLDPTAPARRFAGPVAGPTENPGEDVGLPVDHIGVGVAARGNQTNVFGHRRMGRAGPLAVDYLMEVVGIGDVGRLQCDVSLAVLAIVLEHI